MSALRLARGATGRDLVLKFAGGYHGHGDGLLVEAGSGVATLAIPGSAGVPPRRAAATIVVPYNDLGAVAAAFAAHPGRIAAIIVEPVAANVGVIPPAPGLPGARSASITDGRRRAAHLRRGDHRLPRRPAAAPRRATASRPDLTVLGKIIGGGMPVGAYGGRADLMALVAPGGPGLPGRHAVRPPAGDGRRRGDAAAADARPLRGARGDRRRAWRPGSATAAAGGRPRRSRSPGSARCSRSSSGTAPRPRAEEAFTSDRDAYARFFGAMLDAGVLLAAVAVRGLVPLARPRRGGAGRDARGARRRRSRP